MVNAQGITRSQALREFSFPGEPEPPEIPPEPPLSAWARTRARDGTPIAPPPQTAKPMPKPLPCSFRTVSYEKQAGTVFYLRHFHKQEFPRRIGGVARNMTV
ncbi:hypothetical protein TcCL_NonESM10765 [Trypanosoma cruzi]|nr:hypothetical protein TcCL_NonESM10765 [Trypanosoma cruzi]